MAGQLVNTTKSTLFFKQSATLPQTTKVDFIETIKPIIVVPKFATVESSRLSGSMNSKDESIDLCKSSASFMASVTMRETGNPPANIPTEYAELLKVSGFEVAANPPADTYELINSTKNIGRGSAVVFMDGNKFEFTDTLVGSSEIVLKVGEPAVVNTTLSGYVDNPVPQRAFNPKVSINQGKALVVSCADIITMKGTVIPAEKIVFKTNPVISSTYTMGGKKGIKADTIVDYALTAEITFPVESALFGREAAMIESGEIQGIKVYIGMDDAGKPQNYKSTLVLVDAAKATTYNDTVNNDLLQRTLTLRLFDTSQGTPALKILTGKIAGL